MPKIKRPNRVQMRRLQTSNNESSRVGSVTNLGLNQSDGNTLIVDQPEPGLEHGSIISNSSDGTLSEKISSVRPISGNGDSQISETVTFSIQKGNQTEVSESVNEVTDHIPEMTRQKSIIVSNNGSTQSEESTSNINTKPVTRFVSKLKNIGQPTHQYKKKLMPLLPLKPVKRPIQPVKKTIHIKELQKPSVMPQKAIKPGKQYKPMLVPLPSFKKIPDIKQRRPPAPEILCTAIVWNAINTTSIERIVNPSFWKTNPALSKTVDREVMVLQRRINELKILLPIVNHS
ncbi:hypothetical protein BC833DRAFT_275675 [Globomyces pollinis-pini]|nr:hypothetical protein BC833DRAFT_275675 [Globomyces pollinis-pini]